MDNIKMEFTPEVKEKLKGFSGISISKNFPYTPIVFRDVLPKEQWPVFVLESKSGLDLATIEDGSGVYEYYTQNGQQITRWVPRLGEKRLFLITKKILRIKGYPLEDGRILNYDKKDGKLIIGGDTVSDATSQDMVSYIPIALQVELKDAIDNYSVMKEEELQGLEF